MITNKRTKKGEKTFDIQTAKTAFKKAAITYKIVYKRQQQEKDILNILDASIFAMKDKLADYQKKRRALKFNMSLHLVFEKATDETIVTKPPVVLSSEQFEVYADTFIMEKLKNVKKTSNG